MLVLVQTLINVVLALSALFLWVRLSRKSADDGRLSRGLQLLQGKITVLEDLSDRAETQVRHLSALIDQKVKQVHEQIERAEQSLQKIDQATQKSLEVAQIFQDKIPHEEIIERQNTIKHVQAAKLAHEGKTVEEIASVVDLDRGEIELIAKLNRKQLMFDSSQLPAWIDVGKAYQPAPAPSEALRALGENFRRNLVGPRDPLPEAADRSLPQDSPAKAVKAVDWRDFGSGRT